MKKSVLTRSCCIDEAAPVYVPTYSYLTSDKIRTILVGDLGRECIRMCDHGL
jgi:hypothetical protein